MSDEEVWLYSKFHHIIMDGISLNLLGNQLIDIYQKIMRGEDLAEHHILPISATWKRTAILTVFPFSKGPFILD